ncbi:Fc.00g083040.m01.CDS01 [Cosmosporella sp. VM-42]
MIQREDLEALERRLRQMEAKNQPLMQQLREAQRARQSGGNESNTSMGDVIGRIEFRTGLDGDSDKSETENENEVSNEVFFLYLNTGGQKHYLGSASGAILANLLGLQGEVLVPAGITTKKPSSPFCDC